MKIKLPSVNEFILEHTRNGVPNNHFYRNLIKKTVNEFKYGTREFTSIEDVNLEIKNNIEYFDLDKRSFLNGTGVLIHTGYGNAPLDKNTISYLNSSCGFTPTGNKIHKNRTQWIEDFLKIYTQCPSAQIINNNSSTYTLICNEIAAGNDILLAAMENVEISQGATIKKLCEAGGAAVNLVGSANCITIKDYETNITKNTSAIFKVFPANCKLVGFQNKVEITQLAKLAQKHHIPLIINLGGGSLVDITKFGLPYVPCVADSLAQGADIVCFSGDKIIGGPQAGIILGRNDLVSKFKKNIFSRSFRVCKLTIGALEFSLKNYSLFSDGDPDFNYLVKSLTIPIENLNIRAEKIVKQLTNTKLDVTTTKTCNSEAGGAILPGIYFPSILINIYCNNSSLIALFDYMYCNSIICTINRNCLNIDLRSFPADSDNSLIKLLNAY